MSLPRGKQCYSSSLLSLEEDLLIKKILLTHDPNGTDLDSALLLLGVENIIRHIMSKVMILLY